jgi:hypothetical protein
MGDESYPLPLGELIAGLRELAREGNAAALAALIGLVRERAAEMEEQDLHALARLDVRGAEPLYDAVRREMRRRGVWRGFRAREMARVYGSGARWLAGIVVLAVLLLAAVFGGLIGVKWLLYWLGF